MCKLHMIVFLMPLKVNLRKKHYIIGRKTVYQDITDKLPVVHFKHMYVWDFALYIHAHKYNNSKLLVFIIVSIPHFFITKFCISNWLFTKFYSVLLLSLFLDFLNTYVRLLFSHCNTLMLSKSKLLLTFIIKWSSKSVDANCETFLQGIHMICNTRVCENVLNTFICSNR